jgi:serine/threonine-protein kinase
VDTVSNLNAALSGRYEIERQIGAGGMATVYLARDLKHDRHVALKVLDERLGAILGADRFLREITLTARLQHPHLLPLFDSGEAAERLFYVMPFIEGESLRARLIRETHLPVDDAVRITVAIASALHYAHGHGIVHRDIKPENILLQAGQPVVADFGIALAVSAAGGDRITESGISLGTPQYMSPEQAAGERALDARADVYSLGAVAYEMLVGEPPHTGPTVQSIVAKVISEQPRGIRLARPAVPEQVSRAVEVAIQKIPADRWSSAREFADALEGRAVRTLSSALTTGAATPAERDAGPTWRRRLRDPLTVSLAALAFASGGAAWWNSTRTVDESPTVRYSLTLDSNEVVPRLAGVPFAASPDGRAVVYVGQRGSGTRQLYLRRTEDYRARSLAGTEGATQPFFSPDGEWVAFLAQGQLRKVSLVDGDVLSLAPVSDMYGGSWGNGNMIVISTRNGLSAVDASGAGVRRISDADTASGEVRQRLPLVLDDGRTILYTTWSPFTSFGIAAIASDGRRFPTLELRGRRALGILHGHLLYASMTLELLAVPFDVRNMRPTGAPVPVLEGILVEDLDAKVALSATGTLIYQTGSVAHEVVISEPGREPRVLFGGGAHYGFPRFSPDGKSIALNVDGDTASRIMIYDFASGVGRQLRGSGTMNERPEWTPDGLRVLFRSNRGNESALWWQYVDRSAAAERLQGSLQRDVLEGVVSGDASYLVYRTGSSGTNMTWMRALDGDTASRRIPIGDEVRVSNDSRWIAYKSSLSGRNEVYVRRFPRMDGGYQISYTGAQSPVWSADNRKLYYVTGRWLVAATIETSPVLSVVRRDSLFEGNYIFRPGHASYDVSPDGSKFVLIRPRGGVIHTVVALNWGGELRARLAGRAR